MLYVRGKRHSWLWSPPLLLQGPCSESAVQHKPETIAVISGPCSPEQRAEELSSPSTTTALLGSCSGAAQIPPAAEIQVCSCHQLLVPLPWEQKELSLAAITLCLSEQHFCSCKTCLDCSGVPLLLTLSSAQVWWSPGVATAPWNTNCPCIHSPTVAPSLTRTLPTAAPRAQSSFFTWTRAVPALGILFCPCTVPSHAQLNTCKNILESLSRASSY